MFYLNRSGQIQIDARAGGTAVVLPPEEICEHVVRQFQSTEVNDDSTDTADDQLLWQSLLRVVERDHPDYAD